MLFLVFLTRGEGIPATEWMQYYDQCFKLCTAEKEVELYKMAAKELEKNVLQQLEKIKRTKGEVLLSTYLKLYLDYRQESQSIHRIFAYLHRFWIPNQKNAGEKVLSDDDKVREVYQLALVQWRKYW